MEAQGTTNTGAGSRGIPDGGNFGNPDSGSGGTGKRSRKEKDPVELAILTADELGGKEPEEKKPKKKRKSGKEIGDVADNFKLMLTAIFGMVGERNPIWQVHETEIDLITQPASRIFNRYVSDKTEEYSDIAMLLFGIIILTAPRIILSANMRKEGTTVNEQKRPVQPGNAGFTPKFADSIPGDGHFPV